MPPMTTHLVIGERIFKQFALVDYFPQDYGAFLLGCLLVDVNGFSDVDRAVSHFGDDPLSSCNNFLGGMDQLLIHPWQNLDSSAKAFVLGYYCHLAADEQWKAGNRKIKAALGLREWSDLVPVDIILIEYDSLSNDLYVDPTSVRKALELVHVPDVLNHIPLLDFQHMWAVSQIHVLNHSSLDTYCEMISLAGAFRREIDSARQLHEQYQVKADALIGEALGGVRQRTEIMIDYAVTKMPAFWEKFPLGN
jgi:hypothetical protein